MFLSKIEYTKLLNDITEKDNIIIKLTEGKNFFSDKLIDQLKKITELEQALYSKYIIYAYPYQKSIYCLT